MKVVYRHPNAKPSRNMKLYREYTDMVKKEGIKPEKARYLIAERYNVSMNRVYVICKNIEKKLNK